MQRELLIIRHAKAEEIQSGQDDFDRALKKRGLRDSEKMAKLLFERQLNPDLICSSPAKRTTMTAEIMAEILGYDKEKISFEQDIYEAGLSTLLHITNQLPDEAKRIYMVGHNPGFTLLADYLGDERVDFIPTCGIVYLRFELETWTMLTQGLGHTVWVEIPKEIS